MHPSNNNVLLIGSSYSSVPFLKELIKHNYNVSVCGNIPSDPCHSLVKNSFHIDYSDSESLYQIVRDQPFDYIIPTCNDLSYLSSTKISQTFNFPGFDSLETYDHIHNKENFRNFSLQQGFPVPQLFKLSEFKEDNISCIVKPVDSFSGRGVSKVNHISDLDNAISLATSYSSSKKYIIEAFVEGSLHSMSVFILNGEIISDFYVDEYCTVYPYQVNYSHLSFNLTKKIKKEIKDCIHDLVKKLGLKNGLLHTQFIVDNQSFWIIETMRRCPGDLFYYLIEKSCGFDYKNIYLNPFLNRSERFVNSSYYNKPILRHTISTVKDSYFHSLTVPYESKMTEFFPLKTCFQPMNKAPFDKAGILFTEFKTLNELRKFVDKLKS